MKVLLLIPDGVGIRNYLFSDVIKHLIADGHEVIVWHNLDEEVINEAERIHSIKIKAHPLLPSKQTSLVRLLREMTTFSRLNLNARKMNNPTILSNWSKQNASIKLMLLQKFTKFCGNFISSYRQAENIERLIYRLEKSQGKKYTTFLEKINPDLLFSSHQRIAEVSPIMLEAKKLGIKTATAIFSWDNLPKARLPYRSDLYLVWSNYMKHELLTYYPEINENQIKITGTPQFDFYKNPGFMQSKEEFALKYGLDRNKHWVLFSGDDRLTSPFDPQYLEDFAQTLFTENDIQLILRQVPVESSERYADILQKYPEIKHLNPLWVKGSAWNYSYPSYEDVKMLVNLAHHCKVVINVGSTMALDFAHFNNPGLFINYDQTLDTKWSVDIIYRFQHFRTLDGLNAVGWINNKAEIKDKIRMAITNPELIGPDRLKWMERITQPGIESASIRIAKSLTF